LAQITYENATLSCNELNSANIYCYFCLMAVFLTNVVEPSSHSCCCTCCGSERLG